MCLSSSIAPWSKGGDPWVLDNGSLLSFRPRFQASGCRSWPCPLSHCCQREASGCMARFDCIAYHHNLPVAFWSPCAIVKTN